MSFLLILAVVVLVIQVVLFFMIRSRKKELQQSSEIELKYNIHSRSDAWKILNEPDLPDSDRIKIEDLYRKMK